MKLSILERLSDPAVLSGMSLGERFWGAIVVTVIGMTVCMIALTAIMYAIKLMHAIMGRRAAAPAEGPAASPAPEAPAKPAAPALPEGSCGVASPCAGLVKTVNAAEGAVVRPGDVLLLMEAGGSVFQFPAPVGGKVKRICAAEGDPAEAGQVLVILEETEAEAHA